MERIVKHWNSLPRAAVESLTLEVFETCMDVAPGHMVSGEQGWCGADVWA